MSEVSAYLQPDHFDSDKKNVNDFLGQNPLLLLARTCQNIGVETKSTSSSSASSSSSKSTINGTIPIKPSNPFSVSNSLGKAPPNRTATKASTTMIPPVQSFPPVNGLTSHSPKCAQSSAPPQSSSSSATPHIAEESELYIPPSSNSLIQLARLSSSLKLPTSAACERQKRSTKPIDAPRFPLGLTGSGGASSRPPKRARRQSFGRIASSSLSGATKPLDFSSHFSSHSSPLSISSSVSPSSLRSTPPSHTTPPPAPPPAPTNPVLFDFMKNLAGLSAPTDSSSTTTATTTTTTSTTSSNNLENFFNVGSLLGTSPESLHELLVSIAHSLSERRAAESNFLLEQQQKQQQSKVLHGTISDPSTQCLYCGHVCSDMGSLVQHIYTHLASLHKQQTEAPTLPQAVPPPPPPPPPPLAPIVAPPSTSPFDLVAFYAKLLQKTPESLPSAPPPMVSTDPNALFLAWLNVFRPAYTEGLTGGANR
ncbi:hypothetical protein TcWFU_010416 [Taenia crassiceps]|uniref:C2H2-type domain-containing protein n=1 Tax=Taenia crassiceps TaxID=6207 RepID=A0ABR4QAA2_9CEST